jgi:diguanylate cyclase (GGDEF)-like protein/PAS domain S-box-containing protein
MDTECELTQRLFDEFPALIWRSGVNGKCVYFNKAWMTFTGRTLAQELGDGWTEGVHPDDLDRCVQNYLDAFDKREPFEMDYRLRRANGEYHWIRDYGRPYDDLSGKFAGYIGSCYDINEAKEYAEKMTFMAAHDPLTGVANRRALQDALERAAARAARGRASSLLFIDVDFFKNVNDNFGHEIGDSTLRELTETMQLWIRKEDMLARVGGDEFAALLEGQGIDAALLVAERMRQAVDGYRHEGWTFNLTLSIGIAPVDGTSNPDEVLGRGDEAMYQAKQKGRNRVVVYQPAKQE